MEGRLSSAAAPSVVLGLKTHIELAMLLEFGRAAVPVVGIAHDKNSIGLRFRYLTEGVVVQRLRSPEWLKGLLNLGRRLGAASLLVVSEANRLWLSRHRDEVLPLRAGFPGPEQYALMLNKAQTLRAAGEVGIRVPHTWQPWTLDHGLGLTGRLRFPLDLKWPDPNANFPVREARNIELQKAKHVVDAAAWKSAIRRYAPLSQWQHGQW